MDPYSIPSSSLPTSARRKSPLAQGIEYGLWLTAVIALGSCLWVWIDARRHQAEGSRTLAARQQRSESAVAPRKPIRVAPAYGSAVARIEVARLGLSTVVFEGTGEDVLAHGAGHVPGSALPGDAGNVVFAGHRDTFFRPLHDLKEGDTVTVTDGNGTRRYVVQSTLIVKPNNVGVMAATPSPMLTLITCYPFRFVGSAPDRFIARCREVQDSEPPVTVVIPPAPAAPSPAPPRVRLAGMRSKSKPAPAPAHAVAVRPRALSDTPAVAAAERHSAYQEPAPAEIAAVPTAASTIDAPVETGAAAAAPTPKRRWPARWLGKLTHKGRKGSNPE